MSTETVFEAYTEKSKDNESDTPVLGGGRPSSPAARNSTRVRYFVGTLTNESDVLMLESLMTRSLRCQDKIQGVGDVIMLSEQGTFDKEGCYHIVVKYLEVVEETNTSDKHPEEF